MPFNFSLKYSMCPRDNLDIYCNRYAHRFWNVSLHISSTVFKYINVLIFKENYISCQFSIYIYIYLNNHLADNFMEIAIFNHFK